MLYFLKHILIMNNIERKINKPKPGLLELAKQLGNLSKNCKTFGYF